MPHVASYQCSPICVATETVLAKMTCSWQQKLLKSYSVEIKEIILLVSCHGSAYPVRILYHCHGSAYLVRRLLVSCHGSAYPMRSLLLLLSWKYLLSEEFVSVIVMEMLTL